ncbi:uncharacterized protein KZ484_002799 isoform 1-T2 [Pholidichthys leucotaenia]
MEVPSYPPSLLFELNEQRKRDIFCDCSILVDCHVFKAHRNVLYAGSGYFRSLLVKSLKDSRKSCSTVRLDIVTADAFSVILGYLYSGCLALTRSNVIEVMSAASFLQMTDVVSFCKSFICSSLDIFNKEEDRGAEDLTRYREMSPIDSITAAEISAKAAEEPRSHGSEAGGGSGSGPKAVMSNISQPLPSDLTAEVEHHEIEYDVTEEQIILPPSPSPSNETSQTMFVLYEPGEPYIKNMHQQLSTSEALSILSNEAIAPTRLPFRPKGGELYVIEPPPDCKNEWRSDGHRWENNGICRLPRSKPVVTKCYFYLKRSSGPTREFTKSVYTLHPPGTRFVVHYMGDDSLSEPAVCKKITRNKRVFTFARNKV